MNNAFVQTLFDEPLDIVGDIHGEIEALNHLLDVLGYDEQGHHPEQRKLIFVGDLCDRGVDSFAVIQRVKALVEQGKAQCVLGNHEDMMIQFCENSYNSMHWFKHGGLACFNNYDNDDELISDAQWLKNLPRLIILNNFIDKMGRSLVVSHAPVVDYLDYYLHIREKIEINPKEPKYLKVVWGIGYKFESE